MVTVAAEGTPHTVQHCPYQPSHDGYDCCNILPAVPQKPPALHDTPPLKSFFPTGHVTVILHPFPAQLVQLTRVGVHIIPFAPATPAGANLHCFTKFTSYPFK